MMLLSALVTVLLVCGVRAGAQIDLTCLAGTRQTPGLQDLHRLDQLAYPATGSIRLTMLLPPTWRSTPCCHRVQIQFNIQRIMETQVENDRNANNGLAVPTFVKWTSCSADLAHWFCVAEITDTEHIDRLSMFNVKTGSWLLTLTQCLNHTQNMSDYELVRSFIPFNYTIMAGLGGETNWENGTLPVKGPSVAGNRDFSLKHYFDYTKASSPTLCILRDELVPIDNSWTILQENISLSTSTSMYYNIWFSLETPTNREIFRLYFISAASSNISSDTIVKNKSTQFPNKPFKISFSCDVGQNHLEKEFLNSTSRVRQFRRDIRALEERSIVPPFGSDGESQILRLTIGNAWSGCSVENYKGKPTFRCTGGWTFLSKQTVTIYAGLCEGLDVSSLYVNYSLEFYGPGVYSEECSVTSKYAASTSSKCSGLGSNRLYLCHVLGIMLYGLALRQANLAPRLFFKE